MLRSSLLVTLSFTCGAVFASWFAATVGAQNRQLESKELMRTDLGAWCPGKEVTVTLATNGLGSSGRHFHPAHSFAWVVEGSQTVYRDGQAPFTVRAGDVLHEAPLQIGETRNTGPSKVLIFRISEKGKPATTMAQ